MLHVNHAREPHVNQNSHTECCMFTLHGIHTLIQIPSHFTHSFSKKIIKIPLENLCMWVATLHTIKFITNAFISGVKRAKKKRNSNLWEVCCSQQLLWATCCWDAQDTSCTFCAIAMEKKTVQCVRFTCSFRELCIIKLYGTLVACHLKSVKNVWNVLVATYSSLLQWSENPQKLVKHVW